MAHVSALKGCVSQGKTRDEAIANIREAIEGWLDVAGDLNETGGPAAGTEVVAVAV